MERLESTRCCYHGKARKIDTRRAPRRNRSSHLARNVKPSRGVASRRALRCVGLKEGEGYILLVGNLRLLQHAVSSVCQFLPLMTTRRAQVCTVAFVALAIDYMFSVHFQDLTRTYFSFNFSEISTHCTRRPASFCRS